MYQGIHSCNGKGQTRLGGMWPKSHTGLDLPDMYQYKAYCLSRRWQYIDCPKKCTNMEVYSQLYYSLRDHRHTDARNTLRVVHIHGPPLLSVQWSLSRRPHTLSRHYTHLCRPRPSMKCPPHRQRTDGPL